jgi:hypothetical protein
VKTALLFSLCAACAVTLPVSARAQAPADTAAADARLHLGPLALDPRFAIRNLGVDTNALNTNASPERDVTATVTPELESWLRIGRAYLSSTSSIDWNYFQKLSGQRSFNGAQEARLDLGLGVLRPYVSGRMARTRQRPNLEIDARVEHTTTEAAGGMQWFVGPKLTLDVSRARRTLEFGAAAIGDVGLAQSLNRTEEETAVVGRFAITPLTSLLVDARYREDRFTHAPDRDTDTVLALAGVEFKPLALISGRARLGWRAFTPTGTLVPRFRGVVSDVELSYLVRDFVRITAGVTRDLEYSFEPAEPYYVMTGTNVSVTQALGARWDLVGRAARTSLAYRRALVADVGAPAAGAAAAPARVDRVIVVGGGLGRRVGTDVRIGVDVDRAERRSAIADRAYEGVRVGGTVTYGF